MKPDVPSNLTFNCSIGESGGQVMRTALGLASLLGSPVRLTKIRASRPKPGLQKQHLAAVQALASLTRGELQDAVLNAQNIFFHAKEFKSNDLSINIGSAGSIALLIQTLLLPALHSKTPFSIKVIGGTNVGFAPTVYYLKEVLFPVLQSMGFKIDVNIIKHGFYPQGKGSALFSFHPMDLPLKAIHFKGKQQLSHILLHSVSVGLPKEVATMQMRNARRTLEKECDVDFLETFDTKDSKETKGSAMDIVAVFKTLPRLAGNALGGKDIQAEKVGKTAAVAFLKEFQQGNPVEEHLADQLIPFMALAKGESVIEVTKISKHTLTNIAVCEKFLNVIFTVEGKLNEPGIIKVKGIGYRD